MPLSSVTARHAGNPSMVGKNAQRHLGSFEEKMLQPSHYDLPGI
jgi:hypothetical protein